MYEATTIKPGLCNKCHPRSKKRLGEMTIETLRHRDAIRLEKLRKKYEIRKNLSNIKE